MREGTGEMDKVQLRDDLIQELWRMTKMDIIEHLREFVEGETAAMWYMNTCGEMRVTPSQISENLKVSRARAANILRSLREKGYVDMEISPDDRRKMDVELTKTGKTALQDKYNFLLRYFDLYVDVLGEADILALTRLLKKTVDCKVLLAEECIKTDAEESE